MEQRQLFISIFRYDVVASSLNASLGYETLFHVYLHAVLKYKTKDHRGL